MWEYKEVKTIYAVKLVNFTSNGVASELSLLLV